MTRRTESGRGSGNTARRASCRGRVLEMSSEIPSSSCLLYAQVGRRPEEGQSVAVGGASPSLALRAEA